MSGNGRRIIGRLSAFAAALAFCCAGPAPASADTPFASMTTQQREIAIRETLFAPDNPARYDGRPPPQASDQFQQQPDNFQQQQQALQYQQQQTQQQQLRLQQQQQYVRSNPPQVDSGQQQNYVSQQHRQTREPVANPTQDDSKHIGFSQDGNIKVHSGNAQVDREAESTLNRKFQGFIHNFIN